MTILKRGHHLFENSFGIFFFQPLSLLITNVSMQTASTYIFHYQIHMIICFESFINLDYIRMIHFLKESYFSPYRALTIWICQFRLIINLDSKFLTCALASGNSNYRISSLADLFAERVASELSITVTWRWARFSIFSDWSFWLSSFISID